MRPFAAPLKLTGALRGAASQALAANVAEVDKTRRGQVTSRFPFGGGSSARPIELATELGIQVAAPVQHGQTERKMLDGPSPTWRVEGCWCIYISCTVLVEQQASSNIQMGGISMMTKVPSLPRRLFIAHPLEMEANFRLPSVVAVWLDESLVRYSTENCRLLPRGRREDNFPLLSRAKSTPPHGLAICYRLLLSSACWQLPLAADSRRSSDQARDAHTYKSARV